jgi:hypothetical protein
LSALGGSQRRSPANGGRLSSFFTIARFEPDTLGLFGLLVSATVLLHAYGFVYLSCLTGGILLVIFLVESFENVSPDRVEHRQIVGARCLVLKRVSATERGIARLLRADGRLDAELWSVEASSPILEGETALVSGMRSVILAVVPLLGNRVPPTSVPEAT